jgi:hypothetical protein
MIPFHFPFFQQRDIVDFDFMNSSTMAVGMGKRRRPRRPKLILVKLLLTIRAGMSLLKNFDKSLGFSIDIAH